MGGRQSVQVRSHQVARSDFFDRHAAADRQRLAAYRPRLFIHPYRRHRALSADARPRSVLSDGMGRQRAADRAPGAELLRRALRSVTAIRPEFPAAAGAAEAADLDLASQLCRALPPADEGRRAGVRAPVAVSWLVGRLVDDLRDDRQAIAARIADRLSAPARPGPRLPAPSTHAVGRGFPHGCGPGRARRSRARRRVSPSPVRSSRRGRRRDRDDASRAAAGVRGPGGASRRRALQTPVRQRRADAAVSRARAGESPRARRPRKRQRHRDDLHLRRHHRRHVVARAVAAGSRGDSAERHAAQRSRGATPDGSRRTQPPRSRRTTRSRASRSTRRARKWWSCCARADR